MVTAYLWIQTAWENLKLAAPQHVSSFRVRLDLHRIAPSL